MTATDYKVKFINDEFYIEKNGLILDKFCPNCSKIITEPTDKCSCGGAIINPLRKYLYFLCMGFAGLSICLLISALLILQFGFASKVNIYSVSPAEVIIRTTLKNTKYNDYIQNIYINPDKESELVVFVKPSYWNILSVKEKNEILDKSLKDWKKIYYDESKQKKDIKLLNILPTAVFANK